ncbi:MAG: dUTP diphosphatase [Candidatus Latescibacterota bacterium]
MGTLLCVRVVRQATAVLPTRQTPESAGMDLRAHLRAPLVLAPQERAVVPTGLRLEIPAGYEGQVRPRSGLAVRKGVTVLNAPGTIDADYRGEVGVILVNLSREEQRIEPGERIAQLLFSPVVRAEFVEAETLADSARGAGGFGSTGER